MKKIIVDTSVIIKWLNDQNEERIEQADKILKDVQNNKVVLYSTELAKYEIGNVLLLKKRFTVPESKLVLSKLLILPIEFIKLTDELAYDTYRIARELDITYYDASFIALAKQQEAELVTDNLKHQGRTKEVEVTPLSDY